MNVENYIDQIKELLEKDLGKAMEICEEALTKFPETAKLYYLKALILWNQSEVFDLPREQFSDLLKKATDLDPHYSKPHKLWAYANKLLGYPELALRGYLRAVEADPNDVEALGGVAEMEYQLGASQQALEHLNQLIPMCKQPSDRVYNLRGHTRLKLQDYQGALEDFTKSTEINPNAGGSFWGRGLCKKEMGNLAGALEDFSQLIVLFPQHPAAYMERAAIKLQQQDIVGALKDYQAVVEIEPRDSTAWENIAELQNKIIAQIPEGTQTMHTTLKTGREVTQVPFNGEMVVLFDMSNAPEAEESARSTGMDRQKAMQDLFLSACSRGDAQHVMELLDEGVNIRALESFNESPLYVAAYNGYTDIVKLLIHAGIDLNQQNKAGKTAAMAAAQRNYPEIVDLLLTAGANADIQDGNGQTGLMQACKSGNLKLAQIWLNASDIRIRDNANRTALTLAEQFGCKEIVELLKAAGAKE